MDEKLVIATFSATRKVACTLIELIQDQGQRQANGEIHIDLSLLSREDLANMAGITRQTFTEVLGSYKEKNVIAIPNRARLFTV